MRRWSPGLLPKVNKRVEIQYVRLRNCGLGWNAKLPGKGVLACCSGSFPGESRDLLFRRGA